MKRIFLFISSIILLVVPISISFRLNGISIFNIFILIPIFSLIISLIQLYCKKKKIIIVIKYIVPIIIIGLYGFICLFYWVMFPIGVICFIVVYLLIMLFNYELNSYKK